MVIKEIIKKKIFSIWIKISDLYTELFKKYGIDDNKKNIDYEKLKNLNLNDLTSIGKTERTKNGVIIVKKSFRELFYDTYISYKNNIDFLYKTYPDDLDSELLEILQKLDESLPLINIPFLIRTDMHIDAAESFFSGTWELNKKLKEYHDKM